MGLGFRGTPGGWLVKARHLFWAPASSFPTFSFRLGVVRVRAGVLSHHLLLWLGGCCLQPWFSESLPHTTPFSFRPAYLHTG